MDFKENMYSDFVQKFSAVLRKEIEGLEISKLIFLCIGTDRIIGDAFGPLVGYKLSRLFLGNENVKVIGSLDNIVNANNIEKILNEIELKYEMPFIIAIDAAISNKTEIGRIIVSNSKMNVSSVLMKKSFYVGNLSIKGVVSKKLMNPKNNFKLLQNVPLNRIMNMADCVASGIYNVINV